LLRRLRPQEKLTQVIMMRLHFVATAVILLSVLEAVTSAHLAVQQAGVVRF